MIKIIQGSDKDIILRIVISALSGDAFDLTLVEYMEACFIKTDGTALEKFYLKRTADLVASNVLISNVDTSKVTVGDPVRGAGIALGTTVAAIPTSTSIQLSLPATVTAVGAVIEIGGVSIVSAVGGKLKIALHEADTDLLALNDAASFELKIVRSGFTSYVQFIDQLNVVARICAD